MQTEICYTGAYVMRENTYIQACVKNGTRMKNHQPPMWPMCLLKSYKIVGSHLQRGKVTAPGVTSYGEMNKTNS